MRLRLILALEFVVDVARGLRDVPELLRRINRIEREHDEQRALLTELVVGTPTTRTKEPR